MRVNDLILPGFRLTWVITLHLRVLRDIEREVFLRIPEGSLEKLVFSDKKEVL